MWLPIGLEMIRAATQGPPYKNLFSWADTETCPYHVKNIGLSQILSD